MRGGVLPPALLFAALGLALAFAPRAAWIPSMITLAITLAAVTWVPIPQNALEWAFLVCWISVAGTAASVHLSRRINLCGALALSLNAGTWASVVTTLAGTRVDLVIALPWALLFLPVSWFVDRHGSIPVKVVSSWVIAVAVLVATLQLLPVTPGYLPDHME